MKEEILLKNSFFGGYKKDDVLQCLDSLTTEYETNLQQIKEQIEFLQSENNKLQSEISFYSQTLPVASGELPYEAQNHISMQEAIRLPEGVYEVKPQAGNDGETAKVIHIPFGGGTTGVVQTVPLQRPIPDRAVVNENTLPVANFQQNVSVADRIVPNESISSTANLRQAASIADQTVASENLMSAQNARQVISTVDRMQANTFTPNFVAAPTQFQQHITNAPRETNDVQISELYHMIGTLQAQLEEEKMERQKLQVKLDYSNELILSFFSKR